MSQITLKPLDDGQTAVVIPLGKTTIGRGSLLGCSDKKVSRNHAVLEVTSKGEVYLTPTHVNPCFYQPSEDNPGQILKKDVPHRLQDGDSFSLLPRAYRYQLSVGEKKTEQNDLNKGKTNGSAGDVLEDVHKEPAKGNSNVEPTDIITTDKLHAKSEAPSDKKPPKEDNNSLPKRSSPEATTEDKKEKEPSPPKENNVLHKDNPKEDKEEGHEDEAKVEGDSSNHVGEEEEPEEDKKGDEEKEEVSHDEEPKKESSEEKKASKDEDKRAESCEESRDEGTLDTLPSKVSEEEEEGSKPAKRGGRKKAAKPPQEKAVTKRKAASSTRGRKKKSPAKFDFGPGEEGNSSQRVAGRTSSRTNRQTRQGLSLEDFVVSDDDEWQSDHSSPKRRRKKRGSRRNDDSGSDWEVDHKKPKKSIGAKGGSGSESGSDWGTPKKKGAPKGKRRKGKAAESEEVVSEVEVDQGASSSAPKQRIPCTYGKKCYRRNQNHVEHFSHPGDSDYASDGEADQKGEDKVETEIVKKECPYGANCFRKNAQHKRDFKHTKKVRPQREAAKLADKKAKGSKNSEEVDSYDLNESLLNEDSADEYKHADSGSDYESGERTKKLAKAKVAARGGKRGRRA